VVILEFDRFADFVRYFEDCRAVEKMALGDCSYTEYYLGWYNCMVFNSFLWRNVNDEILGLGYNAGFFCSVGDLGFHN